MRSIPLMPSGAAARGGGAPPVRGVWTTAAAVAALAAPFLSASACWRMWSATALAVVTLVWIAARSSPAKAASGRSGLAVWRAATSSSRLRAWACVSCSWRAVASACCCRAAAVGGGGASGGGGGGARPGGLPGPGGGGLAGPGGGGCGSGGDEEGGDDGGAVEEEEGRTGRSVWALSGAGDGGGGPGACGLGGGGGGGLGGEAEGGEQVGGVMHGLEVRRVGWWVVGTGRGRRGVGL